MNLFCSAFTIIIVGFFFLNIESIPYICSPGDAFWNIVFIFFEVEPVCSLPAGVACILLYILWAWIGVAGPPAKMVIAQACRSDKKLVSGQPGVKPLCHPHATSEEHETIVSIAICFCTMPSSGQSNGTSPGSCSTPTAPWPGRGQPASGTRRKPLHWQLDFPLNS